MTIPLSTLLANQYVGYTGSRGETGTFVGSAEETLTNKTISNIILTGSITEGFHTITGTSPEINPENGTIQKWVLSGNSTPTIVLANNQSLTVHIDNGASFTITWPTLLWAGGLPPTLADTGYTVCNFWRMDGLNMASTTGDMS